MFQVAGVSGLTQSRRERRALVSLLCFERLLKSPALQQQLQTSATLRLCVRHYPFEVTETSRFYLRSSPKGPLGECFKLRSASPAQLRASVFRRRHERKCLSYRSREAGAVLPHRVYSSSVDVERGDLLRRARLSGLRLRLLRLLFLRLRFLRRGFSCRRRFDQTVAVRLVDGAVERADAEAERREDEDSDDGEEPNAPDGRRNRD